MSDLLKEVVGTKYFTSPIDITDPCYDNDVWCRINDVEIKEGYYACVAYYDIEEKRVARIGIYLDGEIPDQDDLEYMGEIGVDAGMAGFFNNKPDYNNDDWQAFCDDLGYEQDVWIKNVGFFSRSGYGDGSYPVYRYKNIDDEIVCLEIAFL